MDNYIKDYLKENGTLLIKNFGKFTVEYKTAEVHPVSNTFSAPGKYVIFTYNPEEDKNDLASILVEKENLTAEQAEQKIADWVAMLRKDLQENKKFELGTLGTFSTDPIGNPAFTPVLDKDISPESFGTNEFTFNPLKAQEDKKDMETAENKAEETEEKTVSQETGKPKFKVMSGFKIAGFTILILFFLCVIVMGVYAVLYPKDFLDKKDEFVAIVLTKFEKKEVVVQPEAPIFISEVEEDIILLDEEDEIETQIIEEIVEVATVRETTTKEEPKTKAEPEKKVSQPKTASVPTQSTAGVGKEYYVVLGSFKSSQNASNFKNELQGKFSNVLDLGKGIRSGLIMIGIGPYEHSEAKQKQAEVLANFGMESWVLHKK